MIEVRLAFRRLIEKWERGVPADKATVAQLYSMADLLIMDEGEKTSRCEKCGVGTFSDRPTFTQADEDGAEMLAFQCIVCGHQIFTPCADAP